MEITYFSWVRSVIGITHQNIQLQDGVKNLEDLIESLKDQDSSYRQVFSNMSVINVSVNNTLVKDLKSFDLNETDKISIFSPMAGG